MISRRLGGTFRFSCVSNEIMTTRISEEGYRNKVRGKDRAMRINAMRINAIGAIWLGYMAIPIEYEERSSKQANAAGLYTCKVHYLTEQCEKRTMI